MTACDLAEGRGEGGGGDLTLCHQRRVNGG